MKTSLSLVSIPVAMLGASALIWLLIHPERYLQAAAGLLLLAVIIGVILSDVFHGRFHLSNIEYFVLASYGGFLGVGMLFDLGDEPYVFNGYAIVLTLAGLLCFLLGFSWKNRPSKSASSRRPSFWVTSGQLFRLSVLFYLLGLAALCAEWYLYGQLLSYSGRFVSEAGALSTPPPMLHVWTQLVSPASIMTLIVLRGGASGPKAFVLRIFLCLTLIWYFLWGARANFLAFAVAWLVVWSEIPDKRGSRRIGSKPVLVFCLALAVMLVLSVVRTDWDFSRARAEGMLGVGEAAGRSLNIFRELCKTVEFFPTHMEYLHGYSFYGVVVNVVPRDWWEGKPVGVGKLASILYDQNPNSSIGLSLPGELYANFGMIGSLIGMVLFGLLVGLIRRWYSREHGELAALVIYVHLIWSMVAEVRGDILDATIPLLYPLFPVAMVFTLITKLNRWFNQEGDPAQVFRASWQPKISGLH